jgi:predicted AlkP superfamily pyrophosphatase or phosphodiesterase
VPATAQNRPKKALFILVDGIPADVIEKVPTLHLDEMARAGKYLRAFVGGGKGTYSESPTISAVGYNSLLTGTWAHKHNVWNNDIKAPNYRYPTIFRLYKDAFPGGKTAIFSSWTDNRTKLAGEGLPATAGFRFDYHADGYELDSVRFPHDKERDFIAQIDDHVTDEAAAYIRKQAPDLSWVYLEHTDDMGHLYGDSPQYYAAVEKMDAQIGRLAAAVRYRQEQFGEDWLVVVTTDHGRDAKTGRHHGGQSDRERSTWIVTNYPILNAYSFHREPGIVDIMPTLARHLNIRMPTAVSREVDGVPLIGEVSLARPAVQVLGDTLAITWRAFQSTGKVKIWLTTSNAFAAGGKDVYRLVAEVPLADEHAVAVVKRASSEPCKIVLEGPVNTVNAWVGAEHKGGQPK